MSFKGASTGHYGLCADNMSQKTTFSVGTIEGLINSLTQSYHFFNHQMNFSLATLVK